jgi:iron complex transport system substrate-binding protein
VVSPCGFPLDRTLEELHELRGALPWESWPAVRAGRVYVADGNAYFNRPGPRIVESLEILAACLRPDAFPDFLGKHRSAVVRVDADLKQHAL